MSVAELPVPSGGPGPDRTPPQDIAAEQSVLGAMLLSKDAIADVVETLREADFYRPAHASVYAAILDLYGRGEPADAVTVAAELTRTGDLGRIGGAPYLHTLVSMVPTAANAGYYARIVQERAVMRRLVDAGTRIVQLGYTAEGDVDQVVDRAQAEVYDVTDKRTSEDYLPLRDIMDGALNEIEAISNRGGQMVGVPTGFADLDSLTNGLHPGQLVVVAARPAIGKCLAASSMVVDARTGDRMTIADFVACGQRGETRVIHTLDEHWRLRAVEPSDFLDNGIRRVFRLQLQSGRRVRATGHHPLRTLAGWVPLEELRPGDRVAVPRPSTPREGWSYAAVPDTLPAAAWEYVDKARGERSWAEVAAIAGLPDDVDWSVVRGDDLPRKIVGDLAEAFDDDDLRLLHDADVVWDRVVSVRPDGHDRVYDLTVEGTHNFVADDVVVHNSTLGLDFTRAASIKHGLTSVIFSLEMSRNEIVMRLLSAEAQVALHHMRSGSMGDSDWQKLAAKMGAVSDAPLFIDDSPNMTMMEIRAKCRRLKQRHDLRLVVVDYLQLMTSGKRVESRQQEVAEFSRSLKLLAKELEVPVIAISQLNRGPEQRQDKKPMLSDLRESGCLTAQTRLMRADTNQEVSLGELAASGARDVPVWALDDSLRYVTRTLTHVFPTGRREVFSLVLASGKRVRATGNHRFLTLDGWRHLADLAPGVRLATPRHVPPPREITPWADDEVVLLAHLLGDGSFVRRQPLRYASVDEANLAAVTKAARHFGVTAVRDDYPQARVTTLRLPSPYRLARGRRNPIASWLDGLGLFGLRSHEKFVPTGVFSLPKDQVRLFLRHLWATDGSVTVRRDGRGGRVFYGSTRRRLLDDVSRLLLRFGITCRIRQATQYEGRRPQYTLDISGADDQRRFLGEIGVHGARGQQAERLLEIVREASSNPNVDTVPVEVWDRVRATLRERGMSHREFAAAMQTSFCGSTLWKHAPSRERLGRVAQVLDSAELDVLATNDVFWDEIVSITPDGVEDVFDGTVLGLHNFIADGIAAHNSIEQDADVVILLNREDAYERESPRAGEADFIVAKHRNGPTATVTVAFQGHYSRFVDMAQM